ncbi:hypothetical protein [Clostridium autoethanogenum]|uniref:Uncharacterized protein n=1 Tax=Clostridium autoethanogenum DSM 10061 TaxID=1341692 RepID=A0ABM5NSS9_9CLOT|nr:hypothetical protein [Clostridium autoethanogenum]AGY75321.1 hypothetical protein CAETHG_1096 [Clostridium autoethanogenum DSM 10061]DAD54143.1 TPA_exp: protein of unknown function KV_032 [Clostridium autoethanogenum DSM 10061]
MFELQDAKMELECKEDISLSCIFISQNFELSKVLIEKELKDDLIKSFIDRFLRSTKEKKVVEYDPIVKLDDCIDSINIQEIPNLNNMQDKFDDISNIKLIDKFSDIETSRAYAIILNNRKSNNKVILFKNFYLLYI